MLLSNRLFLIVLVLCAVKSGAQEISRRSYLVMDLSPVQVNASSTVKENAPDPLFTYRSKQHISSGFSISWIKPLKDIGVGFGVSTLWTRQSFQLDYTFPENNIYGVNQSLSHDFFRFKAGLHGLVFIHQGKLQVGVRLGVYANVWQNECDAPKEINLTVTNSSTGLRRVQLTEKCYSGEEKLTQAITHFDLMYEILPKFYVGGGLDYLVWRNSDEYRFLKFYLKEDREPSNGVEEIPVANDIIVAEPKLMISLKLRYLFHLGSS